ncbi:MAG: HNH endonuclease [Chitinophagaceae bacterium]
MPFCYYCNNPITAGNKSQEHVIPNAIGGRLKSYTLLCEACNQLLGRTIDMELASQFESLVVLLGLERDRKKDNIIRNVVAHDGNLYNLVDGRNPVRVKPIIIEHDNGVQISVRDKKQLMQVIAGLQRKHPNLDLNGLEEKIKYTEALLNERWNIPLNTGGEVFLKAVAKIAINVHLQLGGDRKNISAVLEVLKGNIANESHIHYHYIPESLNWDGEEIVHLVQLNGNSDKGILYAFVVLFSAFSFIVNLDDIYKGDDYKATYAYDVVEGKKVQKHVAVDYDGRLEYLKLLSEIEEQEINTTIINSVQANVNRVMLVADVRQKRKTMAEVLARTRQEVYSKYPPGTRITKEMVNELVNVASPKLAKLWINWGKEDAGA